VDPEVDVGADADAVADLEVGEEDGLVVDGDAVGAATDGVGAGSVSGGGAGDDGVLVREGGEEVATPRWRPGRDCARWRCWSARGE
jgi:hypothetical protein